MNLIQHMKRESMFPQSPYNILGIFSKVFMYLLFDQTKKTSEVLSKCKYESVHFDKRFTPQPPINVSITCTGNRTLTHQFPFLPLLLSTWAQPYGFAQQSLHLTMDGEDGLLVKGASFLQTENCGEGAETTLWIKVPVSNSLPPHVGALRDSYYLQTQKGRLSGVERIQ